MKKLAQIGVITVVAGAMVVPASSSASPVLKDPNPISFGSTINSKSLNAVVTGSPLGTITCEFWEFRGIVTSNTGSNVQATSSLFGNTAGCKAEGLKATVRAPWFAELKTSAKDLGSFSMTFIAEVGPVECHYEGFGGFGYTTGTDTLKIGKIALFASSPLCESEPENGVQFAGDFTMTTESGFPITIS